MDRHSINPKPIMTWKEALHSPCIRMCTLDEEDICIGCGRSLEEIKGWTAYSKPFRVQLLLRCRERLAKRRRAWKL